MKITSLHVRNFRTLENLQLKLPANFAALSGANDSGKTNVVRALRVLMREDDSPYYSPDEVAISFKEDFPKWLSADAQADGISISIDLKIDQDRDAGMYQFVVRQLKLEEPPGILNLTLEVCHFADRSDARVRVRIGAQAFEGLEAQEVHKRIQTSRCIIFYNSTEPDPGIDYRGLLARGLSEEHTAILESMSNTLRRGMGKIAKGQQQELEDLLGRLQRKYRVGLTSPTIDLTFVPFRITLGERKFEVPLENWGSGTRNRTLILLALFRARQVRAAEATASKVTPLIVIEEPESFLHPSAQAEFGKVLQDLAAEFDVQVIVTTHSPYMLNVTDPNANMLLARREHYNQPRETERVDATGDNWMVPFSQALGLASGELKPWTDLLLNQSDSIMLVEGDTDREYFELLRDPVHGANQLDFRGQIVPYEGTGSLRNTVLLRFVKNRHKKLFVTYDLDAEHDVEKTLTALELEKGKHYSPIGVNAAGKRNIEGLLPDSIRVAVYSEHSALVEAAMSDKPDERKSAKSQLKRLLLDRFKAEAKPSADYFGAFYNIVRVANRALR